MLNQIDKPRVGGGVMRIVLLLAAIAGLLPLIGCGSDPSAPDATADAGADGSMDSGPGTDAAETGPPDDSGSFDSGATDAAMDAEVDGQVDAQVDAGDATLDATGASDASGDATVDAGPPMLGDTHRYGAAHEDLLSSVVAAGDGTVFVGGSIRSGAIDIGGTTLPAVGGGSNHVFYARATDGSIRWARRFPGPSLLDTGLAPSTALALAADGTVWASGSFQGTHDFGDGVMRTAPNRNAFLLTLDPTTGATRTARLFGGAAQCEIHDINLRPGGGFALGGRFTGALDVGGGALGTGQGAYVASFDSAGAHEWSHGFVNSIVGRTSIDDAGNTYACGGARSDTDIGDASAVPVTGSAYVPFVSSWDAGGTNRWASLFPDAAAACWTLASSPTGNSAAVFLTSGSGSRVVIDGTMFPSGSAVMVGISPSGGVAFTRAIGTPWAFPRRGPGETFLLTGFIRSPADLGGGPLAHRGGFDTFAASYDAVTGAHLWSESFGSTGSEVGKAIAPSGTGAWVVGSVAGDATGFVAGDFGRRDHLLLAVTR